MRKLPMLVDDPNGALTRRSALATIAGAALTACSGATTVVTNEDGGGSSGEDSGSGGGTDGGGSAEDAGSTGACTGTGKNVGAVTSYAEGTWKKTGTLIIGHDADGIFAYTAICTHQGCTVGTPSSTTGKVTCPCHGAQFDGNGAVLAGPASRPLVHYAVEICGGVVYVDTSMTVAATTRTPVM